MRQLTLSLALLLFPFALLAQEESQVVPDSGKIYKIVQEMPRFPGCESKDRSLLEKDKCAQQALMEFVYQNLKYPELARQDSIEGTVVIDFVVETDGTLTNMQIVREIGGGCGEEGKRVVELMNTLPERWTPGKMEGESVRVLFKLPIKFQLEDRWQDLFENKGRKKKG
jgi:protein TonB